MPLYLFQISIALIGGALYSWYMTRRNYNLFIFQNLNQKLLKKLNSSYICDLQCKIKIKR